jgi:hypothetical protein
VECGNVCIEGSCFDPNKFEPIKLVVSEIRLVFQSKMIQKITTRCIFLQSLLLQQHGVGTMSTVPFYVIIFQRIAASTTFLAMHHISNETVLNKCKYVFKYVYEVRFSPNGSDGFLKKEEKRRKRLHNNRFSYVFGETKRDTTFK